jgi:hypothetical protein
VSVAPGVWELHKWPPGVTIGWRMTNSTRGSRRLKAQQMSGSYGQVHVASGRIGIAELAEVQPAKLMEGLSR